MAQRLNAIVVEPAKLRDQRYLLDLELTTATGSATIRSAWIVLAGQDVLRLTSCYVL